MPSALFEKGLIDQDGVGYAVNDAVSQTKRAISTLMKVLDAVRINPALFDKFCDALKCEEAVMGELIHDLQG